MRRRHGIIVLVAVVAVFVLGVSAALAAEFSDVPADYRFHDDIVRLADLEIIGGFPDGRFRPDESITRRQFAKIIVLATGMHTDPVDNESAPTFTDVTPDMGVPYPFDYIEEAAGAGFVLGANGLFSPGNPITRVQLALIIARAGGDKLAAPPAGYQTGFIDVPDYGQEAVAVCKFNGILDGTTATTFDPYALATRGQASRMVSRLLDKIGEPGTTMLTGTVTNTAGAAVPSHLIITDSSTAAVLAEIDSAADGTYSLDMGEFTGRANVEAQPNAADTYFPTIEGRRMSEGGTVVRDLTVSARTPEGATYTGTAVCAGCHATQAAKFPNTFHARSVQENLSEFNAGGWPAVGAETELSFMVAVWGEDTETVKPVLLHPTATTYAVRIGTATYPVDGTYGGLDPANPEWKQRYLTKVPPEANLQDAAGKQDYLIIPIQWNQNTEFDRSAWVAYSGKNWWNTSTRTFATQCTGCHNTNPTIEFNAANEVTHFDYLSLNITCENCHGPGSAHVAAGGGKAKAIVQPNFLSDLTGQSVCGQCHSRGDSISPEGHEYPWNDTLEGAYPIGGLLTDYSSWPFDLNKGSGNYWEAVDGDPAYPSGYIAAKKHHEQINDLVEGVMSGVKCSQCHNVHGTDFRRNLRGDPNGATAATSACTAAGGCHTHDAIFAADSTHNQAGLLDMGQINNNCTWCHMAETAGSAQFYNVDEAGTYKQGDIANHTFWPIRPDTMDKTGARVPDSCNMIGCHASGALFPVTGATFDAKAAIVTGE